MDLLRYVIGKQRYSISRPKTKILHVHMHVHLFNLYDVY